MDVAARILGVEMAIQIDLDEVVGFGFAGFCAGDTLLADLFEFSLGERGLAKEFAD